MSYRIFFVVLLLFSKAFFSQTKGVLPFTGAKFTKEGISFKEIIIELDEDTWTSNRLPINKQFEIKLDQPSGFKVENGECFPGVSALISKPNGDTLGFAPNILNENEAMDYSMLKNLSLTLGFNEQVKVGDTCNLNVCFFDTKSKNKTSVFFQVLIVASDLPLNNTKSLYSFSSNSGYKVSSTLEIGDFKFKDTLIKKENFTFYFIKDVKINELEINNFTSEIKIYNSKFESSDPLNVKPVFDLQKNYNKEKNAYDLSLKVWHKPNLEETYYFVYRLENKKTNQVIEIYNVFNK